MYAFGSTIDWRTKSSSGRPACWAYCDSLSRSGPTFADARAAVSVWQAPQPLFLNTAAPETDAFGDETAFDCPWSHVLNAAGRITIARARMSACPSPHSSVQMTGNVPSRSGVMCSVGWSPGTVSCFCPNSGTQNEWITSLEVNRSRTERSTGRRRTNVVMPFASGYEKLHANCWAVTLTRNGCAPALSFRPRTIALTIPIAVTSTVGTAV